MNLTATAGVPIDLDRLYHIYLNKEICPVIIEIKSELIMLRVEILAPLLVLLNLYQFLNMI